jgi:hypothetical protein
MEPAPIRALRTGAIVDDRPARRTDWRGYGLAFLLGLSIGAMLGAVLALGFVETRIEHMERRLLPPRPVYPAEPGR